MVTYLFYAILGTDQLSGQVLIKTQISHVSSFCKMTK